MHIFILVLIGDVMLNDFVVKTASLPSILHFVPEAMSVVIAIYVLFAGTRDRFRLIAPKYWLAFGFFALIVLCGVINNDTGAGPVLSGMRFYLRAVPLFFLPAVFPIAEDQIKRQFKWLLGLSLIQLPISIYQRWLILGQGRFSGDDVRGTLMDSGILSVFLICMVTMLTALLVKGRIGKLSYLALFALLLIPTAINETKVTVFFLPLGILVALLTGAERAKRWRYVGIATIGLAIFGALFVPVYNFMQAQSPFKNERDITTLFTNKKQFSRYLSSNVAGVGTKQDVRRGDAIEVPLEYLFHDPVRLAFGLGMGSVSPSNLGKNFEGSYYQLFKKFLITSFTFFLLEFGITGVAIIAVLYLLVFRDSLAVARQGDPLISAVAVGWAAVVVISALGTIYTILHEFTSVTYLYAYFSGLICARCMSLSRDRAAIHSDMHRP